VCINLILFDGYYIACTQYVRKRRRARNAIGECNRAHCMKSKLLLHIISKTYRIQTIKLLLLIMETGTTGRAIFFFKLYAYVRVPVVFVRRTVRAYHTYLI
jgi:hypothetical protein